MVLTGSRQISLLTWLSESVAWWETTASKETEADKDNHKEDNDSEAEADIERDLTRGHWGRWTGLWTLLHPHGPGNIIGSYKTSAIA